MKIVEINSVDYGSTGKIMFHISKCAIQRGHQVYTFSKKWKKNVKRSGHQVFGFTIDNAFHVLGSRYLDLQGLMSMAGTYKLINKIKYINPDIVHLHNLHDSCIHIPMLFSFLNENNIHTVWTFHDCWAFTGGCCYFDALKCQRWKYGCKNCPDESVPLHLVSRDKQYSVKKKLLMDNANLSIVTPSEWLKRLTEESFLKDKKITVINNGIDLSVFYPREGMFRKKYTLENKRIVLGVAYKWEARKGLDVFLELNKKLPDMYQIVLVGTDSDVDEVLENQERNIISIHRTSNQEELAEIYSSADVFVNPTREENFPTVNIEALACGTPVITFNTGGSAEIIDHTCGISVEKEDVEGMLKSIVKACETQEFTVNKCVTRAKLYDQSKVFLKYVDYFESIVKE